MPRTKDLKEKLTKPRKDEPIPPENFVSTSSTMLNLAISGHRDRGFAKGYYYFYVGDSRSGKTWLCMGLLAEAMANPNFKNYRIIYIDVEKGVLMDIPRFFGNKMAAKLEMVHNIQILEDYYNFLDDLIAAGEKFIVITDSMDALKPRAALEHLKKKRKADEKGEKSSGSYNTDKPKINSERMPQVISGLRKTGSILVIISQTRANIGIGAMYNPKTRSGGHALQFYAGLEIWTSIVERLKRNVNGKPRKIGVISRAKVLKNRISGRDRTADIPIYNSFGLDDVGGCVRFLIDEGHWKRPKKKKDEQDEYADKSGDEKAKGFAAPEFGLVGTEEQITKTIDADPLLVRELRILAQKVWNEIEKKCVVERRSRYE